ncbi:hypothetical protein TYRP_008967 [Tyrophagus putrescentiae]|nr:hypothetical protein TYRP_008967 [Tyrophagus putrescentiae]
MTNSSCEYYSSYSAKKGAFQCTEKWFRTVQSALLLFMIFCFIFYMITVGIDIAKLSAQLPLLLVSLSLDGLAMAFIILGVRGVALEIWPYVFAFDLAIVLVTVGHGVTFAFRHTGLNAANFFFDASLAKLAILYTVLLARFEKLKPADYDVRLRAAGASSAAASGANKDGVSSGGVNGVPGEGDQLTQMSDAAVTEITGVGHTGMELSDVIVETAATSTKA